MGAVAMGAVAMGAVAMGLVRTILVNVSAGSDTEICLLFLPPRTNTRFSLNNIPCTCKRITSTGRNI